MSHATGAADSGEGHVVNHAGATAEVVRECYAELTTVMQTTLDRLAAERRFPIIG